jgi:hypothetical protein
MAKRQFQTGAEHIKAAEKGGGKRRFTPNIYWKAGDVHTVAFLTPISEVPKVQLHKMVRIPDDSRNDGYRYETILCQKDASMVEEFGGACILCDQVGHDVTTQFIALAVELDKVTEGKKVKELNVKVDEVEKDGETKTYPRWGLIIQSSKNFFSYFAAYDETQGDIREVAWEIRREGGGTDTKYHSWIVMNGPRDVVELPDMSEIVEQIPDLFDLLEEMASDEKYAMVADLQPGSQPSFGGKKKDRDSGPQPVGERATDFAKVRAELEGKPETEDIQAY